MSDNSSEPFDERLFYSLAKKYMANKEKEERSSAAAPASQGSGALSAAEASAMEEIIYSVAEKADVIRVDMDAMSLRLGEQLDSIRRDVDAMLEKLGRVPLGQRDGIAKGRGLQARRRVADVLSADDSLAASGSKKPPASRQIEREARDSLGASFGSSMSGSSTPKGSTSRRRPSTQSSKKAKVCTNRAEKNARSPIMSSVVGRQDAVARGRRGGGGGE